MKKADGSTYLDTFWGYVFIKHKGHWIREHRFIMEQHLGRKLKRGETVHHINGNRADNRFRNLRLMTDFKHRSLHKQGVPCSEKTRQRMSEAAIRIASDPEERKRRSERAKEQWKTGNIGRKRRYRG